MSPLRQEGRLAPGGEAGAAAAAQAGGVELGDDRVGLHRQRLAQRLVAAAALVDRERREARLVDVRRSRIGGLMRVFAFGIGAGPQRERELGQRLAAGAQVLDQAPASPGSSGP